MMGGMDFSRLQTDLRPGAIALVALAMVVSILLSAAFDLRTGLANQLGVSLAVIAGSVVTLSLAFVLLVGITEWERRLRHRFQANLIRTNFRLRQNAVEMEQLASTGALTGLHNRRAWMEILEQEWRRSARYGQLPAVIMIDLDHFKTLNDRGGHPVGDRILSGFTEVVSGALRSFDVVERLGGDEFAVLLPEADEKEARLVVEKMQEAPNRRRYQTGDGWVNSTLSGGIASGQRRRLRGAPELLQVADVALYAAKAAGRNCVVIVGNHRKQHQASA